MADKEEREKIKLSSLDEAFHANMRAILDGPATGEPATPPPAGPSVLSPQDELMALLSERYGLTAVEPEQARAAAGEKGGLLHRLGRDPFSSKEYHSLVYSLLAEIDRGQRESRERERTVIERFNRFVERQAALNEKLARTVFQLWGDYNHLVNVVLDHQVNVVVDHQVNVVVPHVQGMVESQVEAFRQTKAEMNERVLEVTGLLREVQKELNEIKSPHDDMQKSLTDLLTQAMKLELFESKVEDLEKRLARIESGGREGKGE